VKLFPFRPTLWAAGASLLTVAGGALASIYNIPGTLSIPVFMLLTIVVAWRAGFRASLTVAVFATLGLDFFFTEPRYSLEVSSPRDVFALFTFAATSTLVSHLSHRIRTKSDQLHKAQEQQRLLYEFSRSALLIDWNGSVEEQMCELISERFRLAGVAMLTAGESTVVGVGDTAHGEERLQASFRAQHSYDLPNHTESLRILRFGVRCTGALLMCGSVDPVVADSLATIVATHLERIRSAKSELRAQSQALSERLRTAVRDGLAHAVKTPHTTIIASSSGLREIGPLTSVQLQLAQAIEEQASYLSDVTTMLLRTASVEARDVHVRPQAVLLQQVCLSALDEMHLAQEQARIRISGIPHTRFLVDPELLKLVLIQILENALKYSPASSPVTVGFTSFAPTLEIAIHNEGSFIPPSEQSLIFDRYYRGAATEHKASGTGIGLSAAKHATEAMGGRLSVESSPEAGTTFHISLPAEVEKGNSNAPGFRSDR
jgi:two-component system sensor histidine kinase KdpD